MATRVFYRNGQKVEVEQLDRVIAQPLSDEQRDALKDDAPAAAASDILGDELAGSLANDFNAFRRAGWLITEAPLADDAGGASDAEPVFHDPTQNRLLIGTRRIAVRFRPEAGAQAEAKLAAAGLTVLRKLGFSSDLYQVEVPPGKDPLAVAAQLHEDPAVEYAEPELHRAPAVARFRPTDPQYARQWQWNNDGSVGGVAKADVRAERRGTTAAAAAFASAVIDNGFDVDHPDLTHGDRPRDRLLPRASRTATPS